MFGLSLHPAIVHLPLGLAVVVPLVAMALLLAWHRGWLPRRAWWLAVGMQALLVGGAGAALRTGEVDEERAEEVVPESAIHTHEERAETFVALAVVTLVGLGAAAVWKDDRWAQGIAGAAVLASVVTGGGALAVGHAGGELVYRHGAASAVVGDRPQIDDGDRSHEDDHDGEDEES